MLKKNWKTIQGKVKNVEDICHYRLSICYVIRDGGGWWSLQSLLQCFSFEMNIESYNHQMNYKKYQFHIFDMELLIITHFVANLKKMSPIRVFSGVSPDYYNLT